MDVMKRNLPILGMIFFLFLTSDCCKLARRSIQRVDKRSLQDHVGCHTLSLAGNRIRYIANASFSSMGTSLETLDLDGNWLINITCGMFTGINGLNKLKLSKNRIFYIEDLSFRQLTFLTELNLEYNKLVHIGPNTLYGLSELRSLRLRFNWISDISEDSFIHLPSVREIDMRGNNLSTLYPDAFKGAYSLEILRLDGNKLQSIHSGALSFLTCLKELFLHNNLLSSLNENVFGRGHPKSLQISINGNPMQCKDNKLCWLDYARWLRFMTVLTDGSPNCIDNTKPWHEAKLQCSTGRLFQNVVF